MEHDKFYTKPEIAKRFVDIINTKVNLDDFDVVIEPSAGSGNILQYLPEKTIGLDIEPEKDGIIKQDFFEYFIDRSPLFNNVKVACIGNPPFGSGYMNPLAKKFFNHAAKFSDIIAFIVPAKWHTSWKVHKGLDESFGLIFSEILPKDSFVADGKPHDVNCCMQIWIRSARVMMPKGTTNLRIKKTPPTSHPDFDIFLTCDNVPKTPQIREQLRNKEYWEFGLKYWGKIGVCDIEDVPVDTTTHFIFVSHKPYVRDILEQIDWTKYITNMGAPNVGGKSILVKAYIDKKREIFG